METGCQALLVSLGIRAASRAYSLAGLVPGEMLVRAWGLVLCAHGNCKAGRKNRRILFPIKGLRGRSWRISLLPRVTGIDFRLTSIPTSP